MLRYHEALDGRILEYECQSTRGRKSKPLAAAQNRFKKIQETVFPISRDRPNRPVANFGDYLNIIDGLSFKIHRKQSLRLEKRLFILNFQVLFSY